jgi:ABC-type polysaccharide/polyol phosphate transport system ATPase subunit
MSSETIVRVEGLSKTFVVSQGPLTVSDWMRRMLYRRREAADVVVGLKEVTLDVQHGEWLGLVGDNGSAKTTLLKLMGGLYRPTRGRVRVHGKVTLLSGLGIGMLEDLTVEENVLLYGTLYGVPRERLREKLGEIVAWAELEDFRGAPLRNLSSGMRTRLAFSTARHIDADVHLLDEALTAGDRRFKAKCEEHFQAARRGGSTYVIASHDLDFVERFCDRTLWLERGRAKALGESKEILDRYRGARAG